MVEEYLYSDLTGAIINCAYKVHGTLGAGFLEKIYENAMLIELQEKGLHVIQQSPVQVLYKGKLVGEYFADFVVEDKVIVELKAVCSITDSHEAQLINYLKATKMQVGLLLNFGDKMEICRKVNQNRYVSRSAKNATKK